MTNSQNEPVEEAVLDAARLLQGLDPGGLAELRRMQAPSLGSPAYWRLAARHATTIGSRHDKWMAIVRSLAMLTPGGDPDGRQPLHHAKRWLGQVLCDGGDLDWPGADAVRPSISERRLAQLLSARGRQRRVLLERALRAVARTRRPEAGVNVVDIARWLLDVDPVAAGRRLAESYYRCLDAAERKHSSTQQGATT